MNQLKFVTNPIFLLMLIGSFVYVYFFYLADGPVRNREAAEAEAEFARPIAPQVPNNATTPVAAIVMKEENPFNMGNDPGQMNVLNGGQFFTQQNRQNPVVLQEENPLMQRMRRPRLSRQLDPNGQPVQIQYPYGFSGQNVVPVAGGALGKTWIEAHWVGLEAGTLSAAVAKASNIPPDVAGVLVDEVTLVAADAGLLAGDVITAIDGRSVASADELIVAVRTHNVGDGVTLTYKRAGITKEVTLKLIAKK